MTDHYYHIMTSDGELYHYGVRGMKWGHRKAMKYAKKEQKLTNRLAKDEKRYQKALSKYERVSSKGGSVTKLQKYQNAEQEARARRNKTAAKLDSVKAGRQATTKLMNAYANSPTAVSKLKKTAIDKGSKTVKNLLSNTRRKEDNQ